MTRPGDGPAPGAPPALELSGISKRFGSTLALDRVDLALGPGELLALVGPSGCGKSTLLRIVAGLTEADGGQVRLGGAVVDDGRVTLPPERRRVGLVFQEHALFPHLTVARNVAFGLRGRDRSAIRGRVDEILGLVGLRHLRDRYPHELSGGERQRVALARALAPDPDLLLLDEPFASLDPNLRSQIRVDVVGILHRTGTAAVFVTHDQAEALAVGDRVAVLRDGRLCQVGSPWDVFHQPASTFVAAFMGEAAFLGLERNPGGVATELGSLEPLAADPPAGAVAMVRPDDVTFVADPGGTAEITAVEFRGATWSYTLRLGSGAELRSTRSHLVQAKVGDRVRVAVAEGHRPVIVPGG